MTGDEDQNVTPIRPQRVVGETGGLVDETRVTLAIDGDGLDPDEVSTSGRGSNELTPKGRTAIGWRSAGLARNAACAIPLGS